VAQAVEGFEETPLMEPVGHEKSGLPLIESVGCQPSLIATLARAPRCRQTKIVAGVHAASLIALSIMFATLGLVTAGIVVCFNLSRDVGDSTQPYFPVATLPPLTAYFLGT
jgi:hypothetical protein